MRKVMATQKQDCLRDSKKEEKQLEKMCTQQQGDMREGEIETRGRRRRYKTAFITQHVL